MGSTSQQSVSGRYSGKSDAVTARASEAGARDHRLCQLPWSLFSTRHSRTRKREEGERAEEEGKAHRHTRHARGISIGRHKEKEPMGGSETGRRTDGEQVASISASDSHTKGDRK